MSGWPGPGQAGGDAADLLQLLAAVGRLGQDGRGAGPAPGAAAAHSAQPSVAASSAFHAYQRGPPSNGTELLSALQFWSELYQIAQNGLKNAMAQVAAAYPSLAGGLAALAPAQSPTASAALQLLSGGVQPRSLVQQALAGHSDVSASTAVLAAAVGLPGAASSAGVAPLPDALLAAAARGGSAGAAAPDSQGAGAAKRDWSVDPGASDGSQEPQRKRPRVEGGQPTSHRASGSSKVCSNCHTSNTPFWRKDRHTGLPLCNACGLYAAKNDHHRPVKLWREGQTGSPTQPPRQQQQQPSPAPPQPAGAQPQEEPRAASPRAIAVAAAMQAVMRQAAAAQQQQQQKQQQKQQQQQQQQPGSGTGSPQHCGSPAPPAPQPLPQPLPQPRVEAGEPRGSGSPDPPGTAQQTGAAPSPAAACEAAARSPLQPAPLQEGLKQAPSPYRQAAASLLAATMGVLAQPS